MNNQEHSLAIDILKQSIDKNVGFLQASQIKLDAVFVASPDGFIIRSLVKKGTDIQSNHIAAIVSSLLGIANAAGKALSNDKVTDITLAFENNILVVTSFEFEAHRFIIATLSSKKNNLGQVIFLTKSFANLICDSQK